MTSTGQTPIDFSRKPSSDMEPEFFAYWFTADLPSAEPWSLVFVQQIMQMPATGTWYAVVDFDDMPTYAPLDELRMPKLACAECGEPAQEQPPTAIRPAGAPGQRYSHLDGEPLCPVVGADGYEPCGVV